MRPPRPRPEQPRRRPRRACAPAEYADDVVAVADAAGVERFALRRLLDGRGDRLPAGRGPPGPGLGAGRDRRRRRRPPAEPDDPAAARRHARDGGTPALSARSRRRRGSPSRRGFGATSTRPTPASSPCRSGRGQRRATPPGTTWPASQCPTALVAGSEEAPPGSLERMAAAIPGGAVVERIAGPRPRRGVPRLRGRPARRAARADRGPRRGPSVDFPAVKRYHVTTFGCQMNVHDSERIKGLLESLGLGEAGSAGRRRLPRLQHLHDPREGRRSPRRAPDGRPRRQAARPRQGDRRRRLLVGVDEGRALRPVPVRRPGVRARGTSTAWATTSRPAARSRAATSRRSTPSRASCR